MSAVILTEDELRAKCVEWQRILRLQDWIISVGIFRKRDMKGENRCGEVEWTLEKRMASIRILDPVDYPDGLMEEQDMELTLVHELLHLHLVAVTPDHEDELRHCALEQAIDAISRGLVALKRGLTG
jgi:hypothetical protein